MGVIERIACHACGYVWECRSGCGIMHGTIENVIRCFSEDTGQEIAGAVSRMEDPVFEFTYRPAVCQACGNIAAVPFLEFKKEGRHFQGECPFCGKSVKITEKIEQEKCPGCHQGPLEVRRTGFWD